MTRKRHIIGSDPGKHRESSVLTPESWKGPYTGDGRTSREMIDTSVDGIDVEIIYLPGSPPPAGR